MRNHDIWIYVRCANSDPRIVFDRLYDVISANGRIFLILVRAGSSFDPLQRKHLERPHRSANYVGRSENLVGLKP